MGADLLGISTSGLLVAQQQIATTGHNIANVNTAGYARQKSSTTSRIPGFTGNGFVGTGVEIETTKRYYNEFLEELIRTSNSQLGKQEQFYNIASQIDNTLGDPDSGLTPTLEAFYNALHEVNDYPSSVPTRSVLLTSAQTLVDRFDFLQDQLIKLNDQVNDKLKSVTDEVTTSAESLAGLNAQIIYQVGTGAGQTPNDVLDQREELIKTISEKIDVNVVYQDNGAANVFIGSGQALVLNTQSFSMSSVDSEFTPRDQEIQLSNENDAFNITSEVKGGELQGLLDVKKDVLEAGFNALGRIAASISKEMNEQHRLGMTLQPNTSGGYEMGVDFFNLDLNVDSNRSNLNSDGSVLSFEITDTTVLTTSDYELLNLDGTDNFSLTRLNDKKAISGTLAEINTMLNSGDPTVTNFELAQGFQIDVPTTLSLIAGDKFLIQPTHELARNIKLNLSDVKDVAVAAPILATEKKDALGVGQNIGTATLDFIQLSPNNVTVDASGNYVNNNGTTLDIPLSNTGTNTGTIVFSNFGDTSVTAGGAALTANQFKVTFPDGTSAAMDYDPSSQSGTEISLPGNYDFMKISFTGAPNTADTFTLSNNKTPQDDNRNGLIMAKIQTKKTLENGRADYQRAYGLVVADIGTRTHSSEVDFRAQVTINERAQQNRNSLSGVNLDEEASNLLRFQQSFQASSKVISVANDVFNTLLQSVR